MDLICTGEVWVRSTMPDLTSGPAALSWPGGTPPPGPPGWAWPGGTTPPGPPGMAWRLVGAGNEDRVLRVPGRVVGQHVERVEVVPFGLGLGSLHDLVAHGHEHVGQP